MFERSSNPLRPCFAGDENFRVFIHDDDDDDDGPREVVTFFQRHSPPPFHRPLAVSFRVAYLFSPTRGSPFDAANVSSSKQFFENTFGALKVAPFPPPSVHETKDAARRPCFSPNGNAVTRLPWVCVCRRNSRMHATWWLRQKGRRWKGRRVGLLSILPRVGGKKGAIVGAIVLDVVHRSLSRVYF